MRLTNIKLLLLNVNRKGWHSGNMLYDMDVINRACDVQMYGPGFPNYMHNDINKIIRQLYGSGRPDVIYSYFTEGEKIRDCYIEHYKIPQHLHYFYTNMKSAHGIRKIFCLSDFWARKPHQYSRDLFNSGFEYCFSCFAPPYSNSNDFYAFFDNNIRKQIKFMGLPRCVDKECFKDYGLTKKYDVITIGAMWGFYPLRVHMHNHLSQNSKGMNINYHNYPHCGTDFNHSDFVRDKYAMAISESKMLASCGGRYHVAFNKIFESMGCKTAYIGEKPYGENELHLKDEENYIAVTKDNFIEKILYYLGKPDQLQRIINNAQNTFLQYHTIDARAIEFVNLLKGIL
jgi:hypothetical protein